MNKENNSQSTKFVKSNKNILSTITTIFITTLVVGGTIYVWQNSNL